MLGAAPLPPPGAHPLLAGHERRGGEAVAVEDGGRSQGVGRLEYVVDVREADQSLRGVVGAFLRVVEPAGLGAAAPVPALLPQQAEIIPAVGVEEQVEHGVQAGGQGQDHQEDGFDDLRGDEEEVERGREGEEGHRAVEEAVGEDQPGHVLDHGAVPDSAALALQQAAVQSDVGARDHQEAEHVRHRQGHGEAQGGGFPTRDGVWEAQRGCSVLPDGEERQNRGRGGQHEAAERCGLHPAEGGRLPAAPRAGDRNAALHRSQRQQEDGGFGGEHGQEAGHPAARAALPPGAELCEVAVGQGVHEGQHAAGNAAQRVGSGYGADDKLNWREVAGRGKDGQDHQPVAEHRDQNDDPDAQANDPALKQVLTRLEGT